MNQARFKTKAAVAFILVTAVLDILAMGIVLPVLPALIQEFIGTSSKAGLINGVFVALWAGMQFIAAPVIGSLSDQYGRRPIILLSTAGLAADYVLMALAPNLWWLALGRLIAGVTSASGSTVYAYMADVTQPEKRARVFGLLGAAYSGGFVAGPVIGGVLGSLSPRAPFWVAGALSGLAFIYGMFFLPESLAEDRRMAFSWRRANPVGTLRLLRSHPELSGIAALNFVMYFAYYAFAVVFVLYVSYRYKWSSWEVGVLFAVFGVLDMIVQSLLVGPVTKWFGDRATMVIGLFAGAVGCACMGLAPTGPLFILALMPNALRCLAMPTIQSIMTRRVSESEQGQLQGANMSLSGVAGMLSPVFFGVVFSLFLGESADDPTYSGMPLLISALILAVAAIGGWVLTRRTVVEQVRRDRVAKGKV